MVRNRVSGLSKSFAGKAVLGPVSFSVEAGETLVILGPSGSGKSTLLRCVAGLCAFDAGEVQVNGHVFSPVWRGRVGGVSRLGFIFQDFALFPQK